MSVEPTQRDKGLVLTVRVTAYDNGMVQVDGIPINASPTTTNADGWLSAAEVTVTTINEFRRQAAARQRLR